MEAAAAATALQTFNVLVSSSAQRRSKRTALLLRTPIPLSPSRPVRSVRNRNTAISRWRCSAQRDVDSSGECDRRPAVEEKEEEADRSPYSRAPTPQRAPPPPGPKTPPSLSPLSSLGLAFDLGTREDSWDCHAVGSPVVKRFLSDDEERWYMWYHGRAAADGADSIGLAVSSNGVHWERAPNAVMHPSRDWWAFDIGGIRPSDVLVMSSARVRVSSAVYWLYYTGFTSTQENVEPPFPPPFDLCSSVALRSLPGLAISQDGRHWARIEGEHHSGALLDVGADGEWDSLFIASPRVVFHRSGDLRMYYHSYDVECGCFSIGLARSRDGIRWVKLGKIMSSGPVASFDEAGVVNGHVVSKKDGGYVMAYEGIAADGRRCIGLAESRDGLKDWRRCRDGPILMPPSEDSDGWDSRGVGYPCLVRMDDDDEWRLYYRGVGKEGRTGIGIAVSLSQGGKLPTSFRRWTGFHHM